MRVRIAICAVIVITMVGACSAPFETCAGVGAYGLEITAVDSLTNTPAAAGALLLTYDLARGGMRVDSVAGTTDTELLRGANDRAGRYSVLVRKGGYRDWSKPNVTVHDGCPAIETVRFTARLVRS